MCKSLRLGAMPCLLRPRFSCKIVYFHVDFAAMRLEHRNERVAPVSHFFMRVFRYSLFAAVLVFASVGIGTLGYHCLAGLGWLDSFHMACMILTGMGPVSEMKSEAAKLFSSFYALYSGVAFLSITAVFFAPIIHRLLHILQVEPEEEDQH